MAVHGYNNLLQNSSGKRTDNLVNYDVFATGPIRKTLGSIPGGPALGFFRLISSVSSYLCRN